MIIASTLTFALLLASQAPSSAPTSDGPVVIEEAVRAAPTVTHRLALVIAQNDGGKGRVLLRHTQQDARAFADVLVELGGVPREDVSVVFEEGMSGVEGALASLEARVHEKKAGGARVEAIVYYSGHSDDDGLLLGGDRYPYAALQEALERVGADVKVAILDSCASGSMIREKGGRHLPPFLIDESARVAGIAVLTSSSRDEVAQESDALGASFFTHALVSGLRGAADTSADGRITLHEAYRFAFDETLRRTETASGGAQHPAYDMRLSGTGDLVLTDLRGVSAGLLLADDIDGRVTVRDGGGRLVVELQKQGGTPLLLGLPASSYLVRVVGPGAVREGKVTLADGVPTRVKNGDLASVGVELARLRGGVDEIVPFVPVNIALFPPIESNAVIGRAENAFGFHFIAGRQTRLSGVDIALGGTLVDEDANGVMVAVVGNLVGGDLSGVALSAGANVIIGDASGFLASPAANVVIGDVRGVMASAGANVAIGDVNVGQIAAGANIGLGMNRGAFVAPINVHNDVQGAQIGVINVADVVEGPQIGVINVARSSVAPIGVINVIGDGIHHVGFFSSDAAIGGLRLVLGGRYTYVAFTGGIDPFVQGKDLQLLDVKGSLLGSVGGRIPLEIAGASVFIDIEAGAGQVPGPLRTMFGADWNGFGMQTFARAMFGWRVLDLLTVSAGPAMNLFIAGRENLDPELLPFRATYGDPNGVMTTFSPGFALYVGI